MHTKNHRARTGILLILGSCLLLPIATGCVGGEFYGISALNPYTRRQWTEDEKMGPTFHQQVAELRALKRSASSLDPTGQARIAEQMTALVRDDENPLIRAGAVRVLGEIPTAAALPGIQAASVDPTSLVRIASCEAFGRRADVDAAAALSSLAANDNDVDVRLAAVAALGKCSDQHAIQALTLALDDTNPAIQHRAVQSLKSTTGQAIGENVAAWRAYLHGEPSPTQPTVSLAERLQRMLY